MGSSGSGYYSFGGFAGYGDNQLILPEIETLKSKRGEGSQKFMVGGGQRDFLQERRDYFWKNFCPFGLGWRINSGKKIRFRKNFVKGKKNTFCPSPLVDPVIDKRNFHKL